MGKLKKGRRNQGRRYNPVAAKNGASKQEQKDESTRQSKIVPLISKLSSSAPNDRSVALSTISVLAEDERMRKLLLKERLVPTVMEQMLTDSNEELVVDSLGLLRNLTIEEGYEVAKYLWRSNIWATIESGIGKIKHSLQYLSSGDSDKKFDKKTTLMLFDYIENILSLVVSIASCSQDLYESVYAKIDLVITLVVDVLNWNIESLKSVKLFNSLLDFIYEFASDSSEFVTSLSTMATFSLPKLLEATESPAHEANKLGKVYAQGIFFHFLEVNGDPNLSAHEACARILSSTFNLITSIDIEQVQKNLSTPDNAQAPISKPAGDEQPQDIDMPFGGSSPEKIQAQADLQAIEITLDLFTSICEAFAINENNPGEPVTLSNEHISLLLDTAYPACLHLLQFDQKNGSLALSSKVLVSINNLCWLFLSSSAIPVAWYEKIPELWSSVEQVLKNDDLELQRLALGILWALCKCVGPEVSDKVSHNDVKGLLAKCNAFVSAQETNNGETLPLDYETLDFVLSAVGFLGSVAQVIGNVEVTREIGAFLLFLIDHFTTQKFHANQAKAIEIAVECLNLVYDVFGDAEYDYDLPVFVEGNYTAKLQQLEPQVKQCYKQIDKKKEPELKVRAEEAWTNLGRFIQYKISER